MNKLIVLTGKTASGKDTVMARLLTRLPELKRVISTTSRAPRTGESNGVDYNFISVEDFQNKIKAEEFIEYVQYGGNFYGTEKDQIINAGSDLVWRIDPSRAGQVKELVSSHFSKVIVIYLTVDDEIVLQRLRNRGLSQEEIDKRMKEDAEFWQKYKDAYDFVVENIPGKLDETMEAILQIIEKNDSECCQGCQ